MRDGDLLIMNVNVILWCECVSCLFGRDLMTMKFYVPLTPASYPILEKAVCTASCASAALCWVLSTIASLAAMVGHHIHQVMHSIPDLAAAVLARVAAGLGSLGSLFIPYLPATESALILM